MNAPHPSAGHPSDQGQQTSRGWRLVRHFAGWGLLALGIAGLLLPILPGWVFIAWGAITLAPDIPFFARVLERIAHKVPQLRPAIARVTGKPPDAVESERFPAN